jgi:GH18 family chitinase
VIGSPPAQFRKIAYFETFNLDRPCLNMDISQVDTSKYTHIHFAFLDLTSGFDVEIVRYRDQFDKLVQLSGVKRIVSGCTPS